MLKTRVITAIVLLGLIGLCLFYLPPIAWIIFCAVLLSCSAAEWAQFANYSKVARNLYILVTLLASYSLLRWQTYYMVAIGLYSAAFFWVGIAPLWLKTKWRLADHPMLAALCGWIILLPAFHILYHARLSPLVTQKIFYLVMIVWIADSAAYFAGRAFGKHKLAPFISPGKSWEGVVGAMLVVSLYAFIMGYFFLSFSPLILIGGACLLTAISIVGDLLESLFKRQIGIKNSSNLLPGHGGVLDRVDSLLALLPFIGLLLIWT
jgi:phosphatidate cytidylyltransferase